MIELQEKNAPAPYYEPIGLDFNLYLVTDRTKIHGKSFYEAVEAAMKGGIRALQLREKDLGTRDLLRLAYDMRELTLKYDARLFINDRVDIAVAVDADGVQLGTKSMPPYAVRRFAPRLIIGSSAHNIEEAAAAERNGADFITFGPIFDTPSKREFGAPLGLQALDTVVKRLSIPVFAIGGIKLDNMKDAMERGAHGVALISGIMGANDVKDATLKFLRILK